MEFIDRDKFKNQIGIYKITNTENGKVYIGQTKENFQRRYWLHNWKLRNNQHDNSYLQRSWNKHGEDKFEFSVVEVVDNINLIDDKEKEWIAYYRQRTGSYNIQDGGQPECLNQYISPETRKHVGELNRQRMLGTKLSEETRRKMSESRKGKRCRHKNDLLTDGQAIQIKQLLIQGYKSRDIMNLMGIPYRPINNILSCNAYAALKVEGWEEFQTNRPKKKRNKK